MSTKLIQTKDYLLLIDEEAEIKVNDYFLTPNFVLRECENLDKTKYGNIQDNHRHTWELSMCKGKVIAYYPLTKEAKELDLPLLLNPFKNEVSYNENAIIEAFYADHREWKNKYQDYVDIDFNDWFNNKIEGKQEFISDKQFSLEDMKKAILLALDYGYAARAGSLNTCELVRQNFIERKRDELIIQSLSTQQLPKEFIPQLEYYDYDNLVWRIYNGAPELKNAEKRFKIITNSEGKQELVGTYKY